MKIVAVVVVAALAIFGLGVGLNLVYNGSNLISKVSTPGTVNSVAVSSDGKFTAGGVQTGDASGAVYEVGRNGSVLWTEQVESAISSVAISGDGQLVVAGGSQDFGGSNGSFTSGVILMYGQGGSLLWNYSTGSDLVHQVTISTDGKLIAAASGSGVLLFNGTGSLIWQKSVGPSSVAMSSDGSRIVAGTVDGTVYAFDDAGDALWNASVGGSVSTLTTSSDGMYEGVGVGPGGGRGTFYLLDSSGKTAWRRDLGTPVLSAGISLDDNYVLTGTRMWAALFDIQGDLVWNQTLGGPTFVVLSHDGLTSFVAQGSGGTTVSAFSGTGALGWTYGYDRARAISLSADGTVLAVGTGPYDNSTYSSSSGSIYLFDATSAP